MIYQENEWNTWLSNIAMRYPLGNRLIESERGKEVIKIFLEENKRAFNWRRDDYDTFWIDVQLATYYGFGDAEIRFMIRTQMGLEHYKEHSEERKAYAEMMRGMEKLKKICFPEIFSDGKPKQESNIEFNVEIMRQTTDIFENKLYGDLLSFVPGDFGYQVKSTNGDILNENLDRK